MIKGLGLDVCEIARMDRLLKDKRFLGRYFNEGETIYIQSKGRNAAQTMAGIFAAKEAFAKALGTGIVFNLKEIRPRSGSFLTSSRHLAKNRAPSSAASSGQTKRKTSAWKMRPNSTAYPSSRRTSRAIPA